MLSSNDFILFCTVFLSVYFEYVLKETGRMGGILKWERVNVGHVNNIHIVLDSKHKGFWFSSSDSEH